MSNTDEVKARVDALLRERELKVASLVKGIGMSTSTFYDMWRNGTVTVDRLLAMAKFFQVSPSELLPSFRDVGMPTTMEPAPEYPRTGKPQYIEDRIAQLETEIRKLKVQISNL